MTTCNRGVLRPASLRQGTAAVLGLSAALLTTPAPAQSAPPEEQEVQLDTLKIQDRTADVNPHAEPGAPYKARTSGDSRHVKPLAETPQTITVITETQIKESGRTDLKAILQLQPGVTVGTGENGNKFGDRYILRGSELKSDVFVDGLRDPGMTIRESFNVEQVELTKGPSSTFAGRGSSGGAVNAITKVATTDYDFVNADATGGTDAYVRLTGDVNKRVSDGLAIRVNGLYASSDVPERAPAGSKRYGGAVSVLMKPADNFSVTLDYYHLTAKDRPDLGAYFTGPGGTVVRDVPVYLQDGDFVRSKVDVLTSRIRWDLSGSVRIENAARYGRADNGYVTTGARAGKVFATGAPVTSLDNGHQGWQDIEYLADQLNLFATIELAGMKHQWLFGGEVSNNHVVNGVYALANGPTNCTLANPRFDATKPAGPGNQPSSSGWCVTGGTPNIGAIQNRTYAKAAWNVDWQVVTASAYAMDTVDVTRWLTLFGGVRLDHFDYDLGLQTVNATTGVVTPAAKPHFGYTGNLWNYHGGISIKPGDDGQFYFGYGTAANINGGESDVGANAGYGGFCTDAKGEFVGKPVKTRNFELGTKWEAFQHKLLLTAAVFRVIKDGVCQSAVTINGSDSYSQLGTLNTGKYKVDGLEFGMAGNLTSRLSGQVGLTWMRSRIQQSSTPADIGKKLANFADFQAAAQLRYQFTDRLALGGNITHKSSMATGQPDTAAVYDANGFYNYVIPAYTTFDLFGSYKFSPHLEARVNVQNVGNTDYWVAGYRGGTFVYIGDRRRVTFTLSGKF
jgi:catecholate siderophore receptor